MLSFAGLYKSFRKSDGFLLDFKTGLKVEGTRRGVTGACKEKLVS